MHTYMYLSIGCRTCHSCNLDIEATQDTEHQSRNNYNTNES
jgi:hypothetical protein